MSLFSRAWFVARLEGCAFLLLLPAWLVIAVLAGWRRGSLGTIPGSLRRWGLWIRRGLQPVREAWWVNWVFEDKASLIGQLLRVEAYAARNTGPCGRPLDTLPRGAKVLVLKLAHFGDALHILPMIDALKEMRPDVTIDLLVGPWCRFLGAKSAAVTRTIVYTPRYVLFHRGNTDGLLSCREERRFLADLRQTGYDAVISTSTMNLPELLLLTAARPRMWVGAGDAVSSLYGEVPSVVEPYDSREYESVRVMGLIRRVGVEGGSPALRYPIPEEALAWGRSLCDALRRDGAELVVAMSPGAGWPGKMWPARRFGELAVALRSELKARIVLLGAPSEKELTAEVAVAADGGVENLGGSTTLDQLAAVIRNADLFIGNDSGPLHLAAAFGTPSVALFGPTVASKWAPRGSMHRLIQNDNDCRGCWSWHPRAVCVHDGRCMKAISVSAVMDTVRELMKEAKRAT